MLSMICKLAMEDDQHWYKYSEVDMLKFQDMFDIIHHLDLPIFLIQFL